ncbi:MerR family transcriptional regulator [Phycicoccus endophyticus]|uniref:MerR family transcriptional regulator n=1 Tax=Phycicoccus endophyticus TaxID=1690220 RepID=A0A7G9R0C1_9MICO|nr:MerR family transcriptional regulator [Phycicoccus endophyticus]NHI20144.1 MerR family transcriptional regulator [Phycicoccus endophyticus]QNN49046.1 MerR family transcriptional regulator [Phycicoccus endophyticus]GGL38044.1 MerR family transcriptional regulator [Phycicoccus endophyticus]
MTRPRAAPAGVPIAEAAARTGLSIDALRYYERDGLLLRPVPRSATGHRRYSAADLRWVELLTRLRATGMPIRDMRRYAALVRAGAGNEAERLELMRAHRRLVLDRLAEVTEHLGAIEHKIGVYEDALAEAAEARRAASA